MPTHLRTGSNVSLVQPLGGNRATDVNTKEFRSWEKDDKPHLTQSLQICLEQRRTKAG